MRTDNETWPPGLKEFDAQVFISDDGSEITIRRHADKVSITVTTFDHGMHSEMGTFEGSGAVEIGEAIGKAGYEANRWSLPPLADGLTYAEVIAQVLPKAGTGAAAPTPSSTPAVDAPDGVAIDPLTVGCRVCQVAVGEECQSVSGGIRIDGYHTARCSDAFTAWVSPTEADLDRADADITRLSEAVRQAEGASQ